MSEPPTRATQAENPVDLRLSATLLSELAPELYTDQTFQCGNRGCTKAHSAQEMREGIAEHLALGDSRAAVVVSVAPLLVGAYSDDLDAVVLLAFPKALAERHHLGVGSRLLTVNTYEEARTADGRLGYAVDLLPGPNRRAWSNFNPFIAEFLSAETGVIEARKQAISEAEWSRTEALAKLRVERLGAHTARPGKPTTSGIPVVSGGGARFLAEDPPRRPLIGPFRLGLLLLALVALLFTWGLLAE